MTVASTRGVSRQDSPRSVPSGAIARTRPSSSIWSLTDRSTFIPAGGFSGPVGRYTLRYGSKTRGYGWRRKTERSSATLHGQAARARSAAASSSACWRYRSPRAAIDQLGLAGQERADRVGVEVADGTGEGPDPRLVGPAATAIVGVREAARRGW